MPKSPHLLDSFFEFHIDLPPCRSVIISREDDPVANRYFPDLCSQWSSFDPPRRIPCDAATRWIDLSEGDVILGATAAIILATRSEIAFHLHLTTDNRFPLLAVG